MDAYTIVDSREADGTCLAGYLPAVTYHQIVAKLGKGESCDDGKVRRQWTIRLASGKVATIYDWKEHAPLSALTYWHVGASWYDAIEARYETVRAVAEILGTECQPARF